MTPRTRRKRNNGGTDDDATQWLDAITTDPADGATYTFTGASGIGVMGADTEPIARVRPAPPARETPPPRRTSGPADRAPIAEDTARGWHRMFTVTCEHPAGDGGGHAIPCDQEWRDDRAGSFPHLYESAWDAGWRVDWHYQWHCPDHAQHSGGYAALWPVTHWHPDAPAHREAGDEDGAHRLRAAAEHGVFRGVLEQARQGRHRRPVTA